MRGLSGEGGGNMTEETFQKLRVVPITISGANRFVNQYHRHNKKTANGGGKFAVGAECDLGLVGVAIVGNPIARAFMDGYTAEVLRSCTRPEAPKNTNSFLYGACWRIWQAMGGERLITYTLQTESGSSLNGAGFDLVAEVEPGSWDRFKRRRVFQEVQKLPKYRWQKSRLVKA